MSSSLPPPTPIPPSPSLTHLKSLLTHLLRITTTDQRVFIGTFAGTDKPLNLILINAEEYRIAPGQPHSEGRYVGQIMFPWKMVVKVEAQATKERGREGEDVAGLYFW